jgi:hypothetical protein
MNPDESSDDKKQAGYITFCLECKKVRAYVAKNPGQTSFEIRKATGAKNDAPLHYMLGINLVRFTQEKQEDGRRPHRWYVVPL